MSSSAVFFISPSSSFSQAYGSHYWLITSLSHSAASVAPMEPKCPSLYSPVNMCFCILFERHDLLHGNSYIFVYISCLPSSLLFVLIISLSVSLSSLCISSSCVAQSLLVPGKSPSKYGRRGSAIGIGTVEEVHV